MQHGDLIQVNGESRRYVALNVTQQDIRRYGLNTDTPGLHLFTGYWYPGSPLQHRAYGKIVHPRYVKNMRVTGRVLTPLAARRHCL